MQSSDLFTSVAEELLLFAINLFCKEKRVTKATEGQNTVFI